jgi:hypothetical protein
MATNATNNVTDKTFAEIAATFAPYHTRRAFALGANYYLVDGGLSNPYGGDGEARDSIDAKAWNKGVMAASLFVRQICQYGIKRD